MRLPDLEAWAIFASVVEHGSFTRAAEALGLSKATASKAVTRLEAHLGAPLFHRTSRHLSLTDSGRSLAERAQRMLMEARCAEEAARDEAASPSGTVRLAAPMSFGLRRVAPAIAEFIAAHPEITVDLSLSDAIVDLVSEGFDAALRIAALPDSSLRARRLAPIAIRVVAAPAYLDRHGRPAHPADLGEHRVFCYANVPDTTRFDGPGGATYSIRLAGPLRTNSGDSMLPALRAGLGIAILPDFIVDEDLEAGRLESLLPGWSRPPIALHLVTPPGTLRPARVEALIAFLTERFAAKRVAT